jgi:hypothetical protein
MGTRVCVFRKRLVACGLSAHVAWWGVPGWKVNVQLTPIPASLEDAMAGRPMAPSAPWT